MKHKVWAAGLLCACLLGGCGGGQEAMPQTYDLDGQSVTALSAPEGAELTCDSPQVYIYSGLDDAAGTAKSYVSQLTDEENGFCVVDEQQVKTDAPDFSAEQGTVLLAKAGQTEGELLTVRIDWSQGQCAITADTAQGTITEPEPPRSLTLDEAVDYINSLDPAVLGLDGSDMSRYNVYVMSGAVLVDQHPCMQIKIYDTDNPEQTNDLRGIYLLSGDAQHLYLLDRDTQSVTELTLPAAG